MSSESAEKPVLPSPKDRHKIDVNAELTNHDQKENEGNKEPLRPEQDKAIQPESKQVASEEADRSTQGMEDGSIESKREEGLAETPPLPEAERDVSGSTSPAKDKPRNGESGQSDQDRPAADAAELKEEFEDVNVEDGDLDAAARKDSPPVPHSRPGVTESLPPSAGSNQARKKSIAEDLAEAEEKAELDALSASQRIAGQTGKNVPPIEVPEDQTAFEEENLQSVEPVERPMSPLPAAPPVLPEASMSSPNEPEEYRGLVYYDGVDGLGRPVVVINADALPPRTSRKAAIAYLLQMLEPIVTQGPYVAVFLNTGDKSRKNRLPAGWLSACYRQMSYPFKKNVKYVILVRPSFTLKLMLALMYPLISKKAFPKIKKVETLSGIEAVTNAEVKLQHLGPRFSTIAAKSIVAGEGSTFGQGGAYQMPTL